MRTVATGLRSGLAVGVLLGAVILTSAPAAAQASPSPSGVAEVVVIAGTGDSGSGAGGSGDVTALSKCAVTKYGYTGYRVCEFDWLAVTHSNGSVEYFVVGVNYAVFHIWPGSGGWKSLGGRARTATPNGVYYLTVSGPDYGVATIGTDNRTWCTINAGGRWTSWFPC